VGAVSDYSLRIVWDALAERGFRPHGPLHNFRSVCSGHLGADNPEALHVWDQDGEAKMWCFTHGCDRLDIIEPLSLRLRDLYPPDRQYTRMPLRARRADFTGNARTVANVLLAADRLGLRWRASIELDECPDCEAPHPQLVIPSAGDPFTHCQRGCGPEAFTGGLAQRLNDWRRT
jgi:hypothetical protein